MAKRRDEGGIYNWDGIIEGMPLFTKELIAGGVAGGFSKTVVAPLERVKILFQVNNSHFQDYLSFFFNLLILYYFDGFSSDS